MKTKCLCVIGGLVAYSSQMTFCHTSGETKGIGSETTSRATRTCQRFSDPLLTLLRKFLGDKKVAFRIWQHGIPSIADLPVVYRRRVDSKVLDMAMLQSGLDECLKWYSCLANDIVLHQTQEGFDAHLSASSLDEQEATTAANAQGSATEGAECLAARCSPCKAKG